jgi:hypothetical protein
MARRGMQHIRIQQRMEILQHDSSLKSAFPLTAERPRLRHRMGILAHRPGG